MRSIVSGADSGGTVTVCGTNEGGFRAAVSACRMRPVGEILAGQDGCLRRGPVAVRSGSGRSDCGIYGTSEDGFALFRPPVGGAPLPRGGESREIDYIYRCFGLRRDVSDGKTI